MPIPRPTWLCCVTAAVGGAITGASAGEARLAVWPVDPLVKVLRTDVAPTSPARSVVVDACRGEIENGQIAFRSGVEIEALSARATPLAGPAGQTLAAPRVRHVGYVSIRKNTAPHRAETGPQILVAEAPVDLPDPLLEDDFVPVVPGRTGAIWLTVKVPRTAAPGVYRGEVIVTADRREYKAPLQVTVHAAALPSAMNLKVVNWYYPVVLTHTYRVKWWSEPFWELIAADARSMAEHRLSVGHIILHETIRAVETQDGDVRFDFSRFDRMVETYRRAGLPYLMGSALAGRHKWLSEDFYAIPMKLVRRDGSTGVFPAPEDADSADEAKRRVWVTSDAFDRYLSVFLPAFEGHLDQKGWLGSYIQLQADEPVHTNAAAYVRLGQLVDKYAPKLRRAEANRTTDIVGAVDIWAPLLNHLDQDSQFYRERQAAGDEVWFYTCERPRGRYMNRLIDYPLLKTRLLHWANYLTGTSGYLHWGFNPSWGNPFERPGDPPGDAHLVYPGAAGLRGAAEEFDKRHSLDSLRYEAMRDGIEDYELLRLLAAASPETADAVCHEVVRSLTDYTLDPETFHAARGRLLEAVARLSR